MAESSATTGAAGNTRRPSFPKENSMIDDFPELKPKLAARINRTDLTDVDDLDDDAAEVRIILEALADRIVRQEAALQDVVGKLRATRDAEAAWQLALRARDMAVFGNLAGELAILPIDLVDILAAGRAADVHVKKAADGQISFDDDRGMRAVVPLSFFINLPRILKQWDSRRSVVPVSVSRPGENKEVPRD